MKTTLALLALGVALEAHGFDIQRSAIVGGHETNLHPEVGLVLGVGGCTGTLIGQRTVVTAAHCIEPGVPLLFHLGAELYAVDRVLFHPQFGSMKNDLGLLHLARPSTVTPAVLSRQPPAAQTALTFVGFGVTAETANDFGTKRIAQNVLNGDITDTTFSVEGDGNVCYGDSGGPAFASVNGLQQLVGTVSYGNGPCGTEGVFTRLDAYVDWLVDESGGDVTFEPSATQLSLALKATPDLEVTATVGGDITPTSVFFYADCAPMVQVLYPPYEVKLHLDPGLHHLTAIARSDSDRTWEASTEVTVGHGGCSAAPSGLLAAWALLVCVSLARRRPQALALVVGVLAGIAPARLFASEPPVPSACMPSRASATPTGVCKPDTSTCAPGADCTVCESDADCHFVDPSTRLDQVHGTGHCDAASKQCLACQVDGECLVLRAGHYAACGAAHVCVGCQNDADCALSAFQRCDLKAHTCSLCTHDSQCCFGTDCGATCVLETGACACSANAQCQPAARTCQQE